MDSSPEQRNAAIALARIDPAEALKAARDIRDAWYAAQALATVARFAAVPLAGVALDMSIERAAGGKDEYQRCAVLAWPLRAAIELGLTARARRLTEAACAGLERVELNCSRAEAASVLLQAAFPDNELRRVVLARMLEICPADAHWRMQRLYRLAAQLLAREGSEGARKFLREVPEGRARLLIERDIENGRESTARPFFW